MKKYYLLLFTCIFSKLYACDCPEINMSQAYSRAEDVFIGEIVQIDSSFTNRFGSPTIYLMKIKVITPYKLNLKKDAILTFYTDFSSSCSMELKYGEKYLIFSESGNGSLGYTSYCSGSRLLKNVKAEDFDILQLLHNDYSRSSFEANSGITMMISEEEYSELQKIKVKSSTYAVYTKGLIILTLVLAILLFYLSFLIFKYKEKKDVNNVS